MRACADSLAMLARHARRRRRERRDRAPTAGGPDAAARDPGQVGRRRRSADDKPPKGPSKGDRIVSAAGC